MTVQPQFCDDEAFWNTLDPNDRDTRIYVDADAVLYRDRVQPTQIIIQNLSIHGLRATTDLPPSVGEAIEIELAGLGRFQGVVRWRHQDKFGVHTFEHIDLDVFSDPEE